MTEPIDPQMPMHAAIAPDGAVSQDLPCRKCSYNLRGLTLASRCPECGTAVGYSAQGDLLRFSDPNWVDKLRYGVNLTIAGVIALIFGALALVLLANTLDGDLVILLMIGGGVLVYGLFLAGAWLITTPDPSGLGEDEYGKARKLIRITLFIGLGDTAIQLIPALVPVSDQVQMLFQICDVLGNIVGLISLLATLKYFQKLCRRIPDEKLSGRAQFLFWALGSAYAFLILSSAVSKLVDGRRMAQAIALPLGCAAGIAGLAFLIFGITYLLLIEKMGKRFKEQAAIARQSWAAATQG